MQDKQEDALLNSSDLVAEGAERSRKHSVPFAQAPGWWHVPI